MERIIGFLPSVAVLLWVVAFTQFCVERARSRVEANLNSIQWVKDNPTKVGLVTLPTIWIVGPILEEILFRLPLLFWFNSVDEFSWKWTLISGALFGMMHLPTGTAPVSVGKVFRKHDAGECDSDNLNEETMLLDGKLQYSFVWKFWRISITSVLGVLAGYYAVKHQSLLVAVGIHIIWNVCAVLLPLIFLSLYALSVMAGELARAVAPRRRAD